MADNAHCLRTSTGGSSRQILIEVEGEATRRRLVSPREAARLMGMPDGFRLPARDNDTLHLVGDGVAAPVVRYLSEHLLLPFLDLRTLGDAPAPVPGTQLELLIEAPVGGEP